MNTTFDFHTHTTYSHGTGSILDNAMSAKEKGLKGIAITDHGFTHPIFGMKRSKLDDMRRDCVEAEKITGVKVYLGIEANITGKRGLTCVKPQDYEQLDVFAAGIHRFVNYDKPYDFLRLIGDTPLYSIFHIKPSKSIIKYTTELYINTVKNNPLDFITHINYMAFSDPKAVAECCSDYGTYIEINTKKVHLTDEQWESVLKTDVKFIVNSDAHSPDRVGDTILFDSLDSRVPIPRDRIVNISENPPIMRFNEFKKKL